MTARSARSGEAARPCEGAPKPVVLRACWLSETVVLALCRHLPAEAAEAAFDRIARLPWDGASGMDDRSLLLCQVPPEAEVAAGRAALSRRALHAARCGLAPLLRSGPAAQREAGRRAVLDLAGRALGWVEGSERSRLAAALFRARQVLRVRRPPLPAWPGGIAPVVEQLVRIDARTLVALGRSPRPGAAPRLTLVSPEGLHAEAVSSCAAGVDGRRFFSTFVLRHPSADRAGWIVESRSRTGGAWEQEPPVVAGPWAARQALLDLAAAQPPGSEELLLHHIWPALKTLWREGGEDRAVRSVCCYGTPPSGPAVSVVIPLSGRVDMLEHQLAQLSREPEAAEQLDVLFTVDPRDAFADRARQLSALYPLPFRVLVLRRPAATAAAQALAVRYAEGGTLLLVSPSLIPEEPGWIRALRRAASALGDAGAVAPVLLDPCGSVIHAGIAVSAGPAGVEERILGGEPGDTTGVDPVAALSLRCLLVDRALYHRAGGLVNAYVTDNYAGIAFSSRLRELGRTNYCVKEVRLFDVAPPEEAGTEDGLRRFDRLVCMHDHPAAIPVGVSRPGGAVRNPA